MKTNGTKCRNTKKYTLNEKLSWVLLVLAGVFICVTMVNHLQATYRDIENQRKSKLESENGISTYNFKSIVRQKQDWLNMFAYTAVMTQKSDRDAWWEFLSSFDSEKSRIGVTDREGTLYFGNHQHKDVHEEEYFRRAISGESYVSQVNIKGMNGSDSVIFSVPLKRLNGEILGAAVMEYTVMALGEYINDLDVDWGRYGANLIMDSEGRMVASYAGMDKYDTIYDMLATRDMDKNSNIETMRENVLAGRPGFIAYSFRGDWRMLYYKPMDFNGWTMITVGAMDKYMSMLNEMENRNIGFALAFSAGVLCIFVTIGNLIRCRNERANRMKQDNLTNVYNRNAGEEIVEHSFMHRKKSAYYGCMFVDVDDFKFFNDTYGHDKGDAILCCLGNILRCCSREQDLVYRYGGDEFCIWLSGKGGREEMEIIGRRIISRICETGGEVHVSIGATAVNEDETDWKAIVSRADKAVYFAKKRGKNRMAFFEEG